MVMGEVHCWVDRATLSLSLPLQISSSCRGTFSLKITHAFCVSVCVEEVSLCTLELGFACDLDLCPYWISACSQFLTFLFNGSPSCGIGQCSGIVCYQRTTPFEVTLSIPGTLDLKWPACFYYLLLLLLLFFNITLSPHHQSIFIWYSCHLSTEQLLLQNRPCVLFCQSQRWYPVSTVMAVLVR